jgi:PAS domain S-box-containing protein
VQAALGVEGIVYGRNYRGEPAVAAVRAIPGSPWVLVARMDEAEAFAVVRTRLWVTLLMVGLLVTGAGAGVRTIWQGHRLRGRADLRDRDRHLTVIADNFPGLVARLDRDLRYRFASAGFEHRFGVPAASLVGRRMPDVIGREAWEVARPHAARALAGERAAYEDTLTSASGERLRMLVTLVPDLDAADVVQGIFVVALDITERHRAQEALRSSEERYRRTLDSMREGFQIIGRDWRYVYVNDAAAGHGRRPKDDLLGRTMMEVYPGIEGTAMFAALRRCMEDREFQAFENEFTYPDGTSAWFDLSIDPVPDGISVISLDVTERHRAAEELRVSRERIRELAFAQEETREAERKRLAAELHDELGGALTGIKMDLSWLADRFDTNAREFRDRASEAMKLVDTTVNTVRRMSAELRPGVLDDLGLAAAIQWQVRDFQRRSGLAVRVSGLDAVPPLDAGRTLAVFRILQEALTNVARHARATQIVITVVVADGRLRMEVHDDGQGPRASVSGHREGLGVLGMQERAAAWGGTVTIREDRPRGTVVTLDMPLHPRSPEAS